MSLPDSFNFDEQKLQSLDSVEKKELLLFQWLSTLEKDLMKATINNTSQPHLETLLLKYLICTSPHPNRPTRSLIARCFNIIYSTGDHRTFFDTVAKMQSYLTTKKQDDPFVKIAIIHCIGVLTEVHGAKAMSLMAETVSICQKVLKSAKDLDVPLRYEALKCLSRSIRGSGKPVNDLVVKELMKLAKYGLVDKLPIIRGVSAELLEAIYLHTCQPKPLNMAEFESILVLIVKSLDGSNKASRQSYASLIANILIMSQKIAPIPKVPPKKGLKEEPAIQSDKTILTVEEMLSFLPQLYYKASSAEARVTVIEAFGKLYRNSGLSFIENHYSLICKSSFDLASYPKLQLNKSDSYLCKESGSFLLREVIGKMLSEPGQLRACKDLAKRLRAWPSENPAESVPDTTMICILKELGSLLADLGAAAISIQDDLVEPLLALITHPTHAVRLSLATCMRELCLALPHHITKVMNKLFISLQKEIGSMTSDRIDTIERVVGYGNILSAVIGIVSTRPLFAAYEDAATIFGLATQLLKTHVNAKDYRIMSSQSQISWTLIGSLMSLGPDFVKVHVSQLLLIWKNVFPKTQAKDSVINRAELEWGYLLFSKDSALAALESFITFNGKELVTADVGKRIIVCLHNLLQFLNTLQGAYGPVDDKPPSPLHIKLYERECILKRRLYRCFKLISPANLYDAIFTSLVKSTVDTFALDPEKPDRFLATLGTKDGAFFGTIGGRDTGALVVETVVPTSLVKGTMFSIANDSGTDDHSISKVIYDDTLTQSLDDIIIQNVYPTLEYDPHYLYLNNDLTEENKHNTNKAIELPVPASVSVVDAAIELFALIFPLQNVQTQETVMEQLIKAANHQGGRITPIRKASCLINSLVAVIGALKYAAAKKGTLGSGKVLVAMRDLANIVVKSPNTTLRSAGCEIIGRVARVSGSALFVNPMLQEFVDQVVNSRDPDIRVGACLALGSIINFVGGMAAGSHLRTIVGILHSLASDPHPLVHTWALHSLWLTIESAGLMYGPFVNSTLSLIAKLYMSEYYEPSATAANTPGSDSNAEVYPIFGKILHALVGVIGPELSDSAKLRDICFNLFEQLKNDDNPFVVVEAIRCIQNFIMFAPKHVDIPIIIPFLQNQLVVNEKTQTTVVRTAAVTCLYQLTQRDAPSVLVAATKDILEEQLFALFDIELDPSVRDEIRDILFALLTTVAPQNPSRWINLCKTILSKSAPTNEPGNAPLQPKLAPAVDENKDEDDLEQEAITATPVKKAPETTGGTQLNVMLVPRWRTHVFALECLELVLKVVLSKGAKEDVDLVYARKKKLENIASNTSVDFLVFRLGDLIRIAFNSSTASVSLLRLTGLRLLKSLLVNYSSVPDPEFAGHCLLEQYEAQIISALAPAFDLESSPEVTSAGCEVCSYFLGSGVIFDVTSNLRPFRLLSTLLEQFTGTEPKSHGRTPNAQIMIKLSVLSAWATLFTTIRDRNRAKADELFTSFLPELMSLWMGVLGDFARTLVEDGELEQGANATIYTSASKDVINPYFQTSWIKIMSAVTSLIEEKSPPSLVEFPDRSGTENGKVPKAAFTLIGICVDYICLDSKDDQLAKVPSEHSAKTAACISSLRRLLTPRVLGNDFLPLGYYLELLSLFDKVTQTRDTPAQLAVIELLSQVINDYKETYFDANMSPKVVKTIRIIFNIFAYHIPGLANNPAFKASSNQPLTPNSIQAISKGFELLSVISSFEHLDGNIKWQFCSITLALSAVIFKLKQFSLDLAPQLLSSYRLCISNIESVPEFKTEFANSIQATLLMQLEQLDELTDSLLKAQVNGTEMDKFDISMIKNLSLIVVITLTSCPTLTYEPDFHRRVFKNFNVMYLCNSIDIQLIAVQSIRALMLLSVRSEVEYYSMGNLYVRAFFPKMSQFIQSECITLQNGGVKNIGVLDESLKTYILLTGSYSDSRLRYRTLQILVTLFISILANMPDHSSKEVEQVRNTMSSSLLQFASKQQTEFKSIVQTLSDEYKVVLETCLKRLMNTGSIGDDSNQNKSGSIRDQAQLSSAPKIQLKMNF
ncbi:armadillo-type protein [Globomyces pollinis-pini]|nr:armadillo-type protein [Globomyces pollinis-pini]